MRGRIRMGAMAAVVACLGADMTSLAQAQQLAQRASFDPPAMQSPFRRGSRGQVAHAPAVPSPLVPPSNLAGQDDVLMDDAVNHQLSGDMVAARKTYHQLIKNFPTSRHIPSVYLAFGDYFFDQGQMQHAARFYERVLQFRKYQHLDYAHTKLGWTYINLQQHQKALVAFHKARLVSGRMATATAAEEGMVVAFAHVGKAALALTFFQRHNKQRAMHMLESLAWLYHGQGKAREAHRTAGSKQLLDYATAIYQAYDAAFPSAPDAAAARYYHAEALWRRATLSTRPRTARTVWRATADAFRRVASDPKQPRARSSAALRAARLADHNAACVQNAACVR